MSTLLINADGTLAINRDWTIVTTEGGAPCCCNEPVSCSRVFKFSRCSVIQCPPPGDILPEVYVCHTLVVDTPEGRRNLGTLIDAGVEVTAQWSNGAVQVCYAYESEVTPHTPRTPGVVVKVGRLCGTPECDQDLCAYFWRVRPCGRDDGVPRFVLASQVDGQRGGSFATENPPGSGVFRCFCLRPQGRGVRQDQLPPGAVILQSPANFFQSCCECGEAIGGCVSTVFQEWTGYDDNGSSVYRDVRCCCSNAINGIVAGGSIRVRNESTQTGESFEEVILIDGARLCSDGQWYLTGTQIAYRNDQETGDRTPIGCPAPGVLSFPVRTDCGAYLRQFEEDWRNPSPPPAGFQGSRSISGGCSNRTEAWSVENLEGQQQGSTTRSTSIGSFSIVIRYAAEDACTDDCTRTTPGPPNSTPVDPALAAFLAGQSKMFECKGCGQ